MISSIPVIPMQYFFIVNKAMCDNMYNHGVCAKYTVLIFSLP